MVKLLKKLLIVVLFFGTIYTTYAWTRIEPNHYMAVPSVVDNYPYITEQLLKSSRYTQPNNIDQDRLDDYHNLYSPSFSEEELATINFNLVLENDQFELYLNDLSFAIMLRNKETGYLWSSINMYFQTSDGNRTFRNHGNSGLWIDLVRTTNVVSSGIVRESVLSMADARYYQENENVPDDLLIYAINAGSSEADHSDAVVDVTIDSANSKVYTHFEFSNYGFEFDVELTLTDKGFDAYLNKDSIVETDTRFRLLNIHLFPNLGSAREDKIPGYFVIPDGIGALVRLDSNYNKSFNARFFGGDMGYGQSYVPHLNLPIYGVTHLEGENAFYAYIKEGAEHTNLQATFWGNNTRFQNIHTQYSIRNIYRTIISRAGNGRDAILEEKLNSNFEISYRFLSNDEAGYVGMAKDYQQTLVEEGVLTSREKDNTGNIPLQTSYIMTERENAFIGTAKVTMSSLDQVEAMYQTFKELGIQNQQVTLFGWSEDGFIDRAPYRLILVEDVQKFRSLADLLHADGNEYYMHQNYMTSTSKASRVNYFSDVAYNTARMRMSYDISDLNNMTYQTYFLYPWSSLSMANDDKIGFDYYKADGLALGGFGSHPFAFTSGTSYFDRTNTIDYYQQIGTLYQNSQIYSPNAYLFKDLGSYVDMQIANAQFDYYTDLIPLTPLVLKGYISYFTSDLNFNALGKDRLLNMIDFGMYPSYVLTYEETYKMRFTEASLFYTTSFSNYQLEIERDYHYINDALKHVLNETIVDRVVLDIGIVKITYSNDVVIYVNYSNTAYVVDSMTIGAQDYEVVL